jgi:hypothetical protein
MSELRGIWTDPEQAGRHFAEKVRPFCREQWAQGKRLAVVIAEAEDQRSLQQNGFYWGFVLRTISRAATVDGIGADENGWHYYFKRRVLGYRVTKTKVPGSKRPVIRRELRSTTELKQRKGQEPNPAKYMPDYLDAVMAIAATEFGVTFDPGKRWEDWNA